MKTVTRDIDPAQAQDLLDRAPRVCLAFAGEQGPQLAPVFVARQDHRILVGMIDHVGSLPVEGQEAVLLADEGRYYFDLRAIYIRGALQPGGKPPDDLKDCAWYELVPSNTVAWDYGSMREVEVDHENG